jgi:hypothetical protein
MEPLMKQMADDVIRCREVLGVSALSADPEADTEPDTEADPHADLDAGAGPDA